MAKYAMSSGASLSGKARTMSNQSEIMIRLREQALQNYCRNPGFYLSVSDKPQPKFLTSNSKPKEVEKAKIVGSDPEVDLTKAELDK